MTLTTFLLVLQESEVYRTSTFDSGLAFFGIFQIILILVPFILGLWLFIKVITFLNLKIKLMRRALQQDS